MYSNSKGKGQAIYCAVIYSRRGIKQQGGVLLYCRKIISDWGVVMQVDIKLCTLQVNHELAVTIETMICLMDVQNSQSELLYKTRNQHSLINHLQEFNRTNAD